MLQEHHHMSQNGMQRNTRFDPFFSSRMGMQQMGPPPNHRSQPMLMSIQPPVTAAHAGVLVSMPPGPPLISTPSIPQQPQPKNNVQQVYHYENTASSETAQAQHTDTQQHQTGPNTSTSSAPPNTTLANIKEKTPMCLVNELARYNKIQHQYQLTEESGPAHKKVFTVTLKLGNEEYKSEGPSIKKAQHSAAAQSLAKTEFKHPPSKTARNRPGTRATNPGVMTPTVELNALAMKRGERPVYIVENPPPHQGYINQAGYYPRQNIYGTQNQPRYGYDTRRNMRPHYPYHENRYYGQYRPTGPHNPGDPYTVRLRVGDREYPGVGYTVQAARHDAAAKAIEDIKQMGDCTDQSAIETTGSNDINTELKSPISLVHEIALKRNLSVTFEVLSEKGPPHMKVFVTQCRVGNFVAEGEGNGKKISKKRAAEKMLEELAKLPPLPNMHNMVHLKRKRVTNKKKTRNLIKVNMDKSSEFTEEINPISRLIQIQQANKEREPVYTVLEERGAPRRREFVIEASVNGHSCTGVGPNKKIAKRNAAEALLNQLGYGNPPSNPKPVLKTEKETEIGDKTRKVTFVEEKTESTPSVGGSGGRQLVPGILLVGDQTTNFQQNKPKENVMNNNSNSCVDNKKTSQTQMKTPPQPIQGVRSKDQLMYLAQLMNIQVQFSDFPKANHEMYLTLVSLSTNPPQVCHGEGPTTEASHEKAALEALKVLSELGLDIVGPNKEGGNEITTSQGSSKVGIQNGVKK
ncbi:double-stranded RNA-binding protein Staufen homolog 2-like isoform X2 [Tribolium madens]|uniref:double-stranded RNA-binding protein Staufen homolog 2-like isoform X2 n=1 Tax=Tribolium madens TaxID=41895 RepID=UPI001CF75CFA|nr:double-stranded RNA-binding protein Staufen homolog 2-like isoform X2 [Tribolium madens]